MLDSDKTPSQPRASLSLPCIYLPATQPGDVLAILMHTGTSLTFRHPLSLPIYTRLSGAGGILGEPRYSTTSPVSYLSTCLPLLMSFCRTSRTFTHQGNHDRSGEETEYGSMSKFDYLMRYGL